jgi:hypothetical protein
MLLEGAYMLCSMELEPARTCWHAYEILLPMPARRYWLVVFCIIFFLGCISFSGVVKIIKHVHISKPLCIYTRTPVGMVLYNMSLCAQSRLASPGCRLICSWGLQGCNQELPLSSLRKSKSHGTLQLNTIGLLKLLYKDIGLRIPEQSWGRSVP